MLIPENLGPDFMRIAKPVWESDQPDAIKLNMMWELLTSLKALVLSHALTGRIGNNVFAGPFRGMALAKEIMGQPFAPYLLGSYEWEIHDAIESAIKRGYKSVINVGCGSGYYAVGFALRMPEATVYAFDTDAGAREQCKAMAELNNVSDRVKIAENFDPAFYDNYEASESFIFMDTDGQEISLLDPEKYPALKKYDLITQIHDNFSPNMSLMIAARFLATHNVKIVPNEPFNFPLQKIMGDAYHPQHFDNLLATWERRNGPMPFGIFLKK